MGRYENSIILIEYWLNGGISVIVGLGNSASYELIGIYPHNVLVEVFCEEGIIGGSLYLFILLSSLKAIVTCIKKTKPRSKSRNSVALVSSFFIFSFIISLKQGSLIGNYYFFLFAIILSYFKEEIYTNRTIIRKDLYNA